MPTYPNPTFGNLTVSGSFSVGPVIANLSLITSGSSYTMLLTDSLIAIKKTSGSATAVVLLANPPLGTIVTLKDAKGDAAINHITVTVASSGTIDGVSSITVDGNYASVDLVYFGSNAWGVL